MLGWIACALTAIVLGELMVANALLRVRSFMTVVVYVLTIGVCSFLHVISVGLVLSLLMAIAFLTLFRSYEKREAVADSFHTALCFSVGSLAWPPFLWLALVLPGAGQIYNRKYWKLPIIYGGFMGCIYALTWNNMMYKDYSQAYLDIMDKDPTTASYNKFLHLGRTIDMNDEQQVKRYQDLFKSRKDKYRRWRDMSFFVMLGVYALSVIDAYVDAELSVFDISKDLSLKVEPTVIPNRMGGNPLQAQSVGVNCSLNF